MDAWKIDNKYSRLYDALMQKARDRGRLEGSHEEHHVWPKSLGGDPKGETVDLTIGEHFIAHWLLMQCTEGLARRSMAYVVAKFRNSRGKTRVLTARQYAISKQAASQWFKDLWKDPKYRAKMSEMTRETQKRAMQDPTYRASKSGPDSPLQTQEARAAQSAAHERKWQEEEYRASRSGENHANSHNPEIRTKISASHKAKGDEHHLKQPARRARQAEITAGVWADEEKRAARLAAMAEGQRKRREREAAMGGVRRPDMLGDGNPRRRPDADKSVSPKARAAMREAQQRRREREAMNLDDH